MGQAMGINMIEMYVKMVKGEFEQVTDRLGAYDVLMRQHMDIEARKELGIYDMTIKKVKLEAHLEELKRQLDDIENGKNWEKSPLDKLIEIKMKQRWGPQRVEIEQAMRGIINRIKLCGANQEVKNVFDQVPKLVERLCKKIDGLPKLKAIKG